MANTLEMTLNFNDENSKRALEQLAKHFGKTTKEMKEELKRVIEEATKLQQTLNSNGFFKSIDEAAKKHLKSVEDRFKSMSEKAKQSFEHIHKYARRTFLAIATFTGISLKSFAEFEYRVKKIQTISKDSYEKISMSVRKMAYESGISSSSLVDSLYDIVQVVQDIPGKYKLLETVNKLSVAGFTDSTKAVNLLTQTMLAYNISVKDSDLLASKFLVAQKRGNTTISAMSNNLGKMMAVARQAGVDLNEVLASISTMTIGGVKTEQATTFLRAFLTELTRTESKVGKLFTKITGGLDFKNYLLAGGDLMSAIVMLEEEARKGNQTLVDLFSNIRSAMGAGTLSMLRGTFVDILKEISTTNANLVTEKKNQIIATTKFDLEKMKEVVTQYSREIGDRIAQDFSKVLKITNSTTFDELFNKERIDTIYATGKAILYVTGTITALGLAIKGVETVLKTATFLKTVMSGAGGLATGIAGIGYIFYNHINEKQKSAKTQLSEQLYNKDIEEQVRYLEKELDKSREKINDLSKKRINMFRRTATKRIVELENEKNKIKALETAYKNIISLKKDTLLSVKDDLKKGIINPQVLGEGFEELKNTMEHIQKLVEHTTDEKRIKNFTDTLNKLVDEEILKIEKKEINIGVKLKITPNDIGDALYENVGQSGEIAKQVGSIYSDFKNGKLKTADELKDAIDKLKSLGASEFAIKPIQNAYAEIIKSQNALKTLEDNFNKFISELGVKTKKDLGIEEKISILEKAKNNFKGHISEINIAIQNLQLELLERKITSFLEGVNIASHTYSYSEQKAKIQEATKEIKKKIDEMIKAKKPIKEIKDETKRLEQLNFTSIKLDFDEALKHIKESVVKFKEDAKNMSVSEKRETAKKIIKNIDSVGDKYTNNPLFTEGDRNNVNTELKNVKNETKTISENTEMIKDIPTSINNLAQNLSRLANITGSKRVGATSNILGSIASIGNAAKDFGGISSIASMFSGVDGALSAGLTSLGATAGMVAGGIGAIAAVGSILSARGKKKAAKIDARNAENRNQYNEQVKAMEQLTQAIIKNTERIRTFSDRLLVDIAKNPTLSKIAGGHKNYDTIYDSLVQGKHFNDISALEKGSAKYRSGFRKKSKDTYTRVNISERELLKYLGWDKTELDLFTADEMKQLNSTLHTINHDTLRRATGRNLSESNIEEWKKQIAIFTSQLEYIEKEKKEFFRGTTLENFTGINYREEKELIKEYTESFKEMGLVGEQYNETIKELAKNNQIFVSSMNDVRNASVEGWLTGTGGFVTSMKSYFDKIFKNAGNIVYDVMFSDLDMYFTEKFEQISNKLVDLKRNQSTDFSHLFDDLDFDKLKFASVIDVQAKKSLDALKEALYNNGVDLSIINKILPLSDFNDQINHLKEILQNAMNTGLTENKYTSFAKQLGQQLYDSLRTALVKAFSESSMYQQMIQKFIKTDDFKRQFEQAGSFKEVFNISQEIMKQFGYELEASGFGGFDAINNLAEKDTQLGNAYYTEKSQNVNITFNNNYYGNVYGFDDFERVTSEIVVTNLEKYNNRPRSDG